MYDMLMPQTLETNTMYLNSLQLSLSDILYNPTLAPITSFSYPLSTTVCTTQLKYHPMLRSHQPKLTIDYYSFNH